MKKIDVEIQEDYIAPKSAAKGWRVNDHFAACRLEHRRYQLVHIRTGLRTRWTRPMTLKQTVQFAQAATRKFGAKDLLTNDMMRLIKRLRKAGSVEWSRRRIAQAAPETPDRKPK